METFSMNLRLLLAPCVGLLVFACAPSSKALAPARQNRFGREIEIWNYYPLEVGNQWRYSIRSGGNETIAVTRVGKPEIKDGAPLMRVEALIDGRTQSGHDHLSQTAFGVFRHTSAKQEIVPPRCLLKYPLRSNMRWDEEFTIGPVSYKDSSEVTEEIVEVKAGRFKAMRVTTRSEASHNGKTTTISITSWYVSDVGLVKNVFESGGYKSVQELQEFVPANSAVK